MASVRLEKGSYFLLTLWQVRQVRVERNWPKKRSVMGLLLRLRWFSQALRASAPLSSTKLGLG
jgi:hypothetical protein